MSRDSAVASSPRIQPRPDHSASDAGASVQGAGCSHSGHGVEHAPDYDVTDAVASVDDAGPSFHLGSGCDVGDAWRLNVPCYMQRQL